MTQHLSILYNHFKTASGIALTGGGKTVQSESGYCPCDKEWQPAACPCSYGTSREGERGIAFCFPFLLWAGRQTLHSTGGEGQSVSKDFVIPFGFCPSSNRSSHSGFSVAHLPSASLGAKTSLTLNINQRYELLLLNYLAAVVKH